MAKLLCVAQRHCMPMYTQQLVAANLSGLRMIFFGKTKSIGAKVELQIGQVVKDILVHEVGKVTDDCLGVDVIGGWVFGRSAGEIESELSPCLVSVR